MRVIIIGILMFFIGMEYHKIKTCKGSYDFDYGVCREN